MHKKKVQQQEPFDLETKRKIQDSLQEIYNKEQRQHPQRVVMVAEKEVLSNLFMTENISVYHGQGSFKRSKFHIRTL